MTIEQLEKEFDNKFPAYHANSYTDIWGKDEVPTPDEVKTYIFQELLPQVLSEILPKGTIIEENIMNKYKEFLNSKQKAKEMGIKL